MNPPHSTPSNPDTLSEDSQRLQLIIEAAQVGIWDFNPLTRELIWSDRCKELFGLPPTADITYEIFLQGLHPEDRVETDQVVQEALRPGSTGEYAIVYRTIGLQDGQLRWIRANGRAFFNDAGEAYRFIGTVIDITESQRYRYELEQLVVERTQALQEARLAQEHQEALVRHRSEALERVQESVPVSMLLVTTMRDEAGQITGFLIQSANSLTANLLGRPVEELIGQRMRTIYPDYHETGLFDQYVRTVETGELFRTELHYHYNGLDRWFDVSSVKQDDGLILMQLDITERKNADLYIQRQAEELQRSNTELRQSNESLRQFAHIASHDLQEPLRKIQAFTDVLQNQFQDNLSEGERDMARRIQKSAQRMQLLVKDLLTYSQVTTQRDPFVPVALNSVVTDVVNDLEIAISEKAATINIGSLPTVLGSASRLRQLIQNLIANALKFNLPGQLPVITLSARLAQPDELPAHLREQTSVFWLLTVADNGLGFDEKYKDRIFQPFQRLHTPAQYSGTGIGLAICQRVAESHGGAIDVSSQPGEGATFKVFLPVFADSPSRQKHS